ncbi:MAG: hypothetical protein KAS69_01145 [Planctomycetes bacterium]|nr:hypothetical protein [Planctomycetota bacterium]
MIKRVIITAMLIGLWAVTSAAVKPADSNKPNNPAAKTKYVTKNRTPVEQKLLSMQRDIKKAEKDIRLLYSAKKSQQREIDSLIKAVQKLSPKYTRPRKPRRDAFNTDQVKTKRRNPWHPRSSTNVPK